MNPLRLSRFLTIAVLCASFGVSNLWAHCQVPCGIFDDYLKLQSLIQDADTVIKAANEMQKLAGKSDAQSMQQFIRWTNNKESHAEHVIHSISDYYLAQRVKTNMEDYNERLLKHHAVMIAAMKAKQSANPETGAALKAALIELAPYYPHPKVDHDAKAHTHDHKHGADAHKHDHGHSHGAGHDHKH